MKPLFVLLGAFIICLIATKLFIGEFAYSFSGRIAMSVMLLFTSIGHFAFSKGMTLMMPDFIPFKNQLVYFTGVVEMAAAVGLLLPRLQEITSWLLIVFFILILTVNINAALRNINYQKGTYDGPGTKYLWLRIPLQVLFIAWVYWFGLQDLENGLFGQLLY
jgi:uncharacterized membrane protein